MAAISASRRAASGIALIVAGALFLLAALLPYAGVNVPWFGVLADLAVAVALVILAIGAVNNLVVKVALFAAAVGWALIALGALGLGLPGVLISIAAVVAALGGVVGAVVLLVGREVANTPALVFVAAMVLGAVYLLVPVPSAELVTLRTVLFGVALVVAGVLFRLKERRGRR
jgi:hypothetical protein